MLIVVKVGGDLLKEGLPDALLNDLVSLCKEHQVILVHGGGDLVTEISTKLGHPPKFVTSPKGFRSRYTDKEESLIFTMVMTGLINKQIVARLESRGVTAIGLSGIDAHLIRATRKKQLIIIDERGRRKLIEGGYTGQITEINTETLRLIISKGIMPIISPVAIGEEHEPLNVDGDRMAAGIASSLGADRLVLLTDVKGMTLNNRFVPKLNVNEVEAVISDIGPGMITKVYAGAEAVRNGVKEAIIASGLSENPITRALNHDECTVISK
ncbi:[LysW]-aminoadipate/[LysW]-glutamate kinase [Candidatus Bathyarchaeota archaeon]|nr:[LysW]-aminoadipate/[LysW]-glutamate kinase [Candidatus Bathyarchaeota archaeon]